MGFGRMHEGVGGPKFRPPVGAGHHEGGPDPILVWGWGRPHPQSWGRARGTRTWGGGRICPHLLWLLLLGAPRLLAGAVGAQEGKG